MGLFGGDGGEKKILEGLGAAQANFRIIATHVRAGASGTHYQVKDGAKLKAIIEKWRFQPKSEPISRCGYDYLVVVTNGDVTIPLSICFVCNTLVYDHKDLYKTSRRQMMSLFAADFSPMK